MRNRNISCIYRQIVSNKKFRIKVKLSTYKRTKTKRTHACKQNLETEHSSNSGILARVEANKQTKKRTFERNKNLNSVEWGKQWLFSRGMLSLWFLKSMLHYLTSLSDVCVINLIHMLWERTVENGRSTACHGLNLVLDLNQKLLNFLVFLSSSPLYISVFVLEPLLMYC